MARTVTQIVCGLATLTFVLMSGSSFADDETPESKQSAQPAEKAENSSAENSSAETGAIRTEESRTPGFWLDTRQMHAHYTDAFVRSQGFGIRRVINFDDPEYRQIAIKGKPYSIRKVHLIGLMKDKPVLYRSTWRNPMRKYLDKFPKRALTKVEEQAIDALKSGRHHVYRWNSQSKSAVLTDTKQKQEPEPAVVMTAALRAGDSCIKCHDVSKGTLLGAFQYQLHPTFREDIPAALLKLQSSQAQRAAKASR